jgi:hypothetical protein
MTSGTSRSAPAIPGDGASGKDKDEGRTPVRGSRVRVAWQQAFTIPEQKPGQAAGPGEG